VASSNLTKRAGPIGRSVRLLVAVFLLIIDVPVLLRAGWAYNLATLGLVVALTLFYMLVHYVVSRHFPNLNPWSGAVLAITPVFLVWFLGQGGGPLFGQGEGGTAAITFVALSLLIDVVRADSGCEVMAIPGLIFGNRTHLACIAFCPIDALEETRSADTP
jgi:hypothetical protein